MASTSVAFDILARDRASGAFDKIAKSADKSSSKFSKLGSIAKTAGKAGLAALAVGGAFVAKGLFDATQAAGDLAETISKTNQIFGNRAGNQLAIWAKDADIGLGMSQQTALDAAATFGVFGKAAGKSGQDLRLFAQQNTALAADLASFHNSTPEEAIEALGAAFRGEAEPIRKFGVLLDDATLRQQALRMGLIKTTSEALTPQQKTLAAQAVIMKQTKDAQGDFARTSGGLANQQRILKAQFENLTTSIGQKLLPVALKLTTWANEEGIPALKEFGGWLGDHLPPIFEKVGDIWSKVTGAMSGDTNKTVSNIRGILQDLGSIFRDAISIAQSLWRQFGDMLTAYTKSSFSNALQIIRGAFQIIAGIFKVFSSLLKGDWKGVWDGIKQILRGAWTVINGLVKQALNVLKLLLRAGWSVIKSLTKAAWDGIKQLPRLALEAIKAYFRTAITGYKVMFKAGWEALKSLTRAAWSGLTGIVKAGADKLVDYVRSIPGRLRNLAGSFASAGKAIIGAFVNGLRGAGGLVSDIAGNVWSALRGMLNSAIGKINSALEFSIGLPGPDIHVNPPDIPYLARGTNYHRGGWAVVGEDGPELVDLPRGSRVMSNRESMGSFRGAGGSQQPVIVQLVVSGKVLEQVLIKHTRDVNRPLQVRTLGATA